MNLHPRTLATRFSLLYLALVLSAIGMGGAALWTVKRWGEVMDDLSRNHALALEAEHLRNNVSRLAKELSEVQLGDPNAPKDLAELRIVIGGNLLALQTGVEGGLADEALKRIGELHSQIQNEGARMLEAMAPAHPDRRFRIGQNEYMAADPWELAMQIGEYRIEKRLLPALSDAVDDLGAEFARRDAEAKAFADAAYRTGTALSVVIFALAALQLIAFTVFLRRRFRAPIETIRRATARMSQGDLSQGVELNRDDELGMIARDITGMAKSLRESRERLVQAERLAALGEVAAYLAHNLRNPLAGIRSAAQAAQEDAGDPALCRETFADIIHTVDKLSGWTQSILRYISPAQLQRVPVQAAELMEAVERLAQGSLAERGIHVRIETEPGLPVLAVDAEALEQALHAVLLNAADAAGRGTEILLRAWRSGGGVSFSVEDHGKGMSPWEAAQATRPFYTTKAKGMGLGLAMADKVVRGHGGGLSIESAPGEGTTVTFHIPARAA